MEGDGVEDVQAERVCFPLMLLGNEGISWSKGVDSVLWLMVRLVEKTWGCQVIPTH